MIIINVLMNYFSHRNYGQYHLHIELQKETDKRGIQVGGATRFSSFCTHTKSIQRCFLAIERCLSSGAIKFDTKAVTTTALISSSAGE